MKKMTTILAVLGATVFSNTLIAQEEKSIPYKKIFAYGLDANVQPALNILDSISYSQLNDEDSIFKYEFEQRFKYENDRGKYQVDNEKIDQLYSMFRSYWRQSMLNPEETFDGQLAGQVVPFLLRNFPEMQGKRPSRDSIGFILSSFITSEGLHTRSKVDRVGRLPDLPIWQNEQDTLITVNLPEESFEVEVVFMQDFISYGWSSYATLNNRRSGGWAEQNKLFCAIKLYDLNSEDFRVSFLAHEARHLVDMKLFPKLKSPDLEYRAKLTELILAKETLFDTVESFINDANANSENSHPLANYYVIHHLSKKLFSEDFCSDLSKWKKIKVKKINQAADDLLKENTAKLTSLGPDVEKLINTK
ncbi:hypothetical protein [Fulvivirga lutea]|uniref:Uncharacterized protein n=1 Tax=Fulvivirga lutea TaxID=2810512 RepID=A0A974WIA9_9BACT|nr:hypothetical protein [Fulvivirga lutea]QSE98956.1 hypothetical protein JR347_07695 [Fulvivirga lutea]